MYHFEISDSMIFYFPLIFVFSIIIHIIYLSTRVEEELIQLPFLTEAHHVDCNRKRNGVHSVEDV
jgi:hypothetical protein